MVVREKDEEEKENELLDPERQYCVESRYGHGKIVGGICGNCGAELSEKEADAVYQEIDFDAPNTEIAGGFSIGSM